jgi:hypothetical protein
MTDKQTPPDWVIREAARKCGTPTNEANYWHTYDKAFRALCDMIERYEARPVDRKLLCAKEAFGEWMGKPATDDPMKSIAVRAIELWEEGFGK